MRSRSATSANGGTTATASLMKKYELPQIVESRTKATHRSAGQPGGAGRGGQHGE